MPFIKIYAILLKSTEHGIYFLCYSILNRWIWTLEQRSAKGVKVRQIALHMAVMACVTYRKGNGPACYCIVLRSGTGGMWQVAFGDAVTAESSSAFRKSSVGSPICLVFQHSYNLRGCIFLDVFVFTCWPQTFSSFSLPSRKRLLVNIWHDVRSDNNFTKHEFCVIYFILS